MHFYVKYGRDVLQYTTVCGSDFRSNGILFIVTLATMLNGCIEFHHVMTRKVEKEKQIDLSLGFLSLRFSLPIPLYK